jgi:hypothetical protein
VQILWPPICLVSTPVSKVYGYLALSLIQLVNLLNLRQSR